MPILPDHDQPNRTIAHHKYLSFSSFRSYISLLLASGFLSGFGDFTAGFLGLGDTFDDTDSDSLCIVVSNVYICYSMAGTRTCLMSRTAKRPNGG